MNQHGPIIEEIARQYDAHADAAEIYPSALAYAVYVNISNGAESDKINYLSMEHLKQMCREFLRRRKDADGEENDAHSAQGDLDLGITFSGKLQDRYPVPRGIGEEARYKRRALLTSAERDWNVQQLRKSAQARLEHADALQAEGATVSAA